MPEDGDADGGAPGEAGGRSDDEDPTGDGTDAPFEGAGEGGAAVGDEDGTGATAVRGDRYAGGPARSFISSLSADRRIFAADLAVDRAHVVMLDEQEILEGADAAAILAALDDVERAGHDALPEGEDVHEAIETAVIEAVGPDGGRMHTARSRNDEVATCIRYRLRADLLSAAEATLSARAALSSAAEAGAGTLLPGFTHGQYAQPTTVGHFLASYESALARDTGRLLDAYGRTNRSPLGAAAFAGTGFDVDRERTADLLGFEGLVVNAADAVSARDFLVESVAALVALATTLSGLATDLVGFVREGYVSLDPDYASTSSIMPQKENPDSLELVRATAGDAAGALSGLATTLSGLPRAYNRDLQRATPHAWRAVDAVTEATDVAAGAVATADWDADACRADAGAGFSTATDLADALARAGVPFRTAHRVVADAARRAADRDREGADGNGDDGERTGDGTAPTPTYGDVATAAAAELAGGVEAYLDRPAVERALDPAASVAARDSTGGPAPAAVRAALEDAREALDADRRTVGERREALDAADRRRREAVERVRAAGDGATGDGDDEGD